MPAQKSHDSKPLVTWAIAGALLGLFLHTCLDLWALLSTAEFARVVSEEQRRLILEGQLIEYLDMRRVTDFSRVALIALTAAPVLYLFSCAYQRVTEPRWRRTYAVTAWFVPITQLLHPLRIAAEIDTERSLDSKKEPSWTLIFWWCSWLTSLGFAMLPADFQNQTDAVRHLLFRALGHGFAIVAAVLLGKILVRWFRSGRFLGTPSKPEDAQ